MSRYDALPTVITEATPAAYKDSGTKDPHTDHHELLHQAVIGFDDALSADLDFATDPGLSQYILNQPTGIESYVPSIVFGRYRLTAPATTSDVNLRMMLGAGKAGVMADSEIRSSWFASSTAMSDAHNRFQPGHSHRINGPKQVAQRGTATAGGSATISNSAAPWTTNQWAGAAAFQVQYYVTIIGGTGFGQTRRIISNATNQLTVDSNWTVTPGATSQYEIWSRNNRGISWTKNIAFGAHALFNLHCWDAPAYNLIGGADFQPYLKPGGSYSGPNYVGGSYVAFPWFVKTRVRGRTAEIAVWKGSDPETAYGTSGRSASFTLPDTHDQPGESGIYLGHLQANDWMDFDDLNVLHL